MGKKLSPFFEEFFFESLISYFEILKGKIEETNSNSLGSIEKIVHDTFLKYMDRAITIELVENTRETFLHNVENRNILEKLKKNTILPIFHERFNYTFIKKIENKSEFTNKIIKSGTDLFYECALVFSKGSGEKLIDYIYEKRKLNI